MRLRARARLVMISRGVDQSRARCSEYRLNTGARLSLPISRRFPESGVTCDRLLFSRASHTDLSARLREFLLVGSVGMGPFWLHRHFSRGFHIYPLPLQLPMF
ncbi:hypothetical protein PYCCODRAFT_179436 [Trametes coccinea BRFM310]|uniref:Uncharacterized protein n=1 Tax=Trametes coccinea (strain BRFM310) TaxID=1353009 RepID=A0A1Y2ITY2_TRAC3|nr:hypothetical protein PYCCODRAFT_179436 [Trametes coccinea BRFM310]